MKKAIILLSGGIDSTVCAAWAKQSGYLLYGIGFNYTQKHSNELLFAKIVSGKYCVEYKELSIPSIQPKEGNYFPARNTIFLSFALSYAECVEASEIIIGVNADDTFFPDCLPGYISAFEKMASVATKNGNIIISTPVINLTKTEIIKVGASLWIDFKNTLSCYNGDNCGECGSCLLRKKGFTEALLSDPIKYKS